MAAPSLQGRCIDLLFLIPILSVVSLLIVLHSPCHCFCECVYHPVWDGGI
jgi:hypothetical protein